MSLTPSCPVQSDVKSVSERNQSPPDPRTTDLDELVDFYRPEHPDPFGQAFPSFVEEEERLQQEYENACPCCIDRQIEIDDTREARAFLQWANKPSC